LGRSIRRAGGLDPAYGQGGKVETGFGHNAIPERHAAADGQACDRGHDRTTSIIGGRGVSISCRYLANGASNTGFGSGGSGVGAFSQLPQYCKARWRFSPTARSSWPDIRRVPTATLPNSHWPRI